MDLKSPEDPNVRKSGNFDRTFLTDIGKPTKEVETDERIKEYYSQLKDQVAKLDTHIDNVLQKHEADFLNAFKCQMFSLYTQLRELKKKTDDNELKLKRDEQLNKLQTSLDWFREEAVHLGETTTFYKKEAEKWKAKADSLEDDRKFLEEQLRSAKKRIKELQEQRPSEAPSELSIQLPRSNASFTTKFVPTSKSGIVIMEILQKYPVKQSEFLYEIEKYMNNLETRFQEILRKSKMSLSFEKKKLQSVSAQQTSTFFEKSELEGLFLECVDEVRKDVVKRRTQNVFNQKFTKRAGSSQRVQRTSMTPSDKRKILELLVSNDQILLLLYEKLFPHKSMNYSALIRPEEGPPEEKMPSIEELLRQVPSRATSKPSTPQRIFL